MEIRGRNYPEYVRPVVFFILVVVLFAAVVVAYGFPEVENQGECYQEINICHGVPGDTCIGFETSSLEQRQSCEYEEEIKTLCREARKASCQNDTVSRPMVRGKECSFWRETFEIEKRKCSDIS